MLGIIRERKDVNMKKQWIYVGIFILILSGCSSDTNKQQDVPLIQEVGEQGIAQVSVEEAFAKIDQQESFIMMVTQSTCSYCNSFKKTLVPFLKEHEAIPFFELEMDMVVNKKADIITGFEKLQTKIPEFSGGTPELIYFEQGKVQKQSSGELSSIGLRNFMIDCGLMDGEKQVEKNEITQLATSEYLKSSDFIELAQRIENHEEFYLLVAENDRFNEMFSNTLVTYANEHQQTILVLNLSDQKQPSSEDEMSQLNEAASTVSSLLLDFQLSPTIFHINEGTVLDQLMDNVTLEEVSTWFTKQ